jgi:hypothetical protein
MRAAALVIIAALAVTAACAADQPPGGAPQSQASIAFANQGGIYDWRAVDDRTVLIQALNHQWYKASLFSPCIDLPFAQTIGFVANPDGSFDKFSAIQVRDQDCPLISLVKTAPPTKKSKPHPAPQVTTAARPAGADSATPPAPAPPPPQ